MSKYTRTQLFNVLDSLQKANELIRKLLPGEDVQQVVGLLTECQSCAITIGNQIEKLYGENTKSVHSLEEYCEAVYQLSESLVSHTDDRLMKYSALCSRFFDVKSRMEEEIPDRLEVVFLPYKASMWDSLESIWKAANQDENCDTYVIPIPYFDKNPDGSFLEEHWEKELYPIDVPITNYKEYDLELHHPDVIYIHNPYDDGNFVTSVHPDFYSKNLKMYTDKLVYIPYFVLDEINPDDSAAIDRMKHFCLTMGVINADEVIVQSENMRQIYIDVLMDYFGESRTPRVYWENKIKGSGSPKIEKIINTTVDELSIPEEWKKIIYKPDGTKKKIVFYNISVSALLDFNETMIDKIKNVLDIFKANQETIVLLWRPHPLIKATIKSMRPKLWNMYEKVVENYKSEGWGIYDDSTNMDRAVIISDAYYGDQSSVLVLFKKLNKMNMIQSPPIIYQNLIDTDYVWSNDFGMKGNTIYFVSYWYNYLYKYNTMTNNIEYKVQLPITNEKEGLYKSIICAKNRIVLVPENANAVCIYDETTNEFKKLLLPFDSNKLEKFSVAILRQDEVFLFPDNYSFICKINLLNDKIEFDPFLQNNQDAQNTLYFEQSHCLEENVLYLLIKDSNLIYQYNFKTFTVSCISVGDETKNYKTINRYSNEELCLSDSNGEISIYNERIHKLNVLYSPSINDKNLNSLSYISSQRIGDCIYFFPKNDGKCITLDINTSSVQESFYHTQLTEEGNVSDPKGFSNMFSQIKQNGNYLYGFNIKERFLFEINIDKKQLTKRYIEEELDEQEEIRLFNEYSAIKDSFLMENVSLYFNLYMQIKILGMEE